MAIEVPQEALEAPPGEGRIAVALNNFHGRWPGGYKRRLLNTPSADKTMRELLAGTTDEPGKHSALRLDQTTRQFFGTIDTLLQGLGLGETRSAELVKVAGSSGQPMKAEERAALTEYERIGVELYKALKLMGYTDSDIVG